MKRVLAIFQLTTEEQRIVLLLLAALLLAGMLSRG